jgi:hypothetical protein
MPGHYCNIGNPFLLYPVSARSVRAQHSLFVFIYKALLVFHGERKKLLGFQSEFANRVYNIHRSNALGRIARGSDAPKLRTR